MYNKKQIMLKVIVFQVFPQSRHYFFFPFVIFLSTFNLYLCNLI